MPPSFHAFPQVYGDFHRFGKSVEKHSINEQNWFIKPRLIKIEQIFLDKAFQIPEIRELLGFDGPAFTESYGQWEGRVSCLNHMKVPKNFDPNASKSYAINSGKLISIATFLGIIDLHFENIIISQIGNEIIPIPIDIETIFWDCISGMDTLLYQSSLIEHQRCGLSGIDQNVFATNYPVELLDSFLDSSEKITSKIFRVCPHFNITNLT